MLYLKIPELRGFEKILHRSKSRTHGLKLTTRICGVCPVATPFRCNKSSGRRLQRCNRPSGAKKLRTRGTTSVSGPGVGVADGEAELQKGECGSCRRGSRPRRGAILEGPGRDEAGRPVRTPRGLQRARGGRRRGAGRFSRGGRGRVSGLDHHQGRRPRGIVARFRAERSFLGEDRIVLNAGSSLERSRRCDAGLRVVGGTSRVQGRALYDVGGDYDDWVKEALAPLAWETRRRIPMGDSPICRLVLVVLLLGERVSTDEGGASRDAVAPRVASLLLSRPGVAVVLFRDGRIGSVGSCRYRAALAAAWVAELVRPSRPRRRRGWWSASFLRFDWFGRSGALGGGSGPRRFAKRGPCPPPEDRL